MIDATLFGNAARFMNGSCEPNLKQAPMRHDEPGLPRVLFRARRHIAAGEELTWQYGAESAAAALTTPSVYDTVRRSYASARGSRGRRDGATAAGTLRATPECFCGSSKCRGVL